MQNYKSIFTAIAAEIGVDAVVTGNLKEVRPYCRMPE